jgi:hypothetical protein
MPCKFSRDPKDDDQGERVFPRKYHQTPRIQTGGRHHHDGDRWTGTVNPDGGCAFSSFSSSFFGWKIQGKSLSRHADERSGNKSRITTSLFLVHQVVNGDRRGCTQLHDRYRDSVVCGPHVGEGITLFAYIFSE